MMKKINKIKSGISVGNADSAACYGVRNLVNIGALFTGKWYPEGMLKACLYESGEPDWWKDFPGCASSEQCYNTR